MRKNVLFIAKFDNILKGMNAILAKSFNMQMCPPEPAMVEKMLGVMELDVILLYISGLPENILAVLCAKLEKQSLHTPIMVFGTAEECKSFDGYCPIAISKYMHRPLAAQDIVNTIGELYNVPHQTSNESQLPPELQVSQEPQETPAPQSPQTEAKKTTEPKAAKETAGAAEPAGVKKGMSLADFADSLGNDERRCILLVDDDGRILRAMKMLLEKNYRINLANSGMSALESIERERPDAVLLDYEMPVFDGKQTLEMIRKNQKTQDLPVFFLTGVADKERIRDVIHLRPQGYLLKSSEQSAILETLEKFFNS